jgi:hypothetical protein
MSALVVLLTISCQVWGQSEKNLVTYTIDGGVFHHQQITIHSDPEAMENGAMSGNFGYLKINLDDAPRDKSDKSTGPKWSLDIAFSHPGTGTAKVNDPITNTRMRGDKRVYFLLQVQVNGKTKYLNSDTKEPEKTPGTITITRFGPVGGTVEGNFEGTLKGADGIYTITGGHFVVIRKL